MSEINFDYVIGRGRALKAKIEEIAKKHEEELKPFKAAKVQLDAVLLDMLNKTGQQNSSTPSGGVHKVHRVTYSVADADEFMRHVIGTEQWDLLNRSVNATAAEDYLVTNKELPPGVKRSEMITVSLTVPTKKRTRAPAPTPVSNPPAEVAELKEALWERAEAEADAALAAQQEEGMGEGEDYIPE